MSLSGHTCVSCWVKDGERYCEGCVSSYLCRVCRKGVDAGRYNGGRLVVEMGEPEEHPVVGVEEPDMWADEIPLANNGCCPTCRRPLPDEPLDVAICHAMPDRLGPVSTRQVREEGPSPETQAQPERQLFMFWSTHFIGVRVGRGNGASGIGDDFDKTVVYWVATTHPTSGRRRLAVVWTVNNNPNQRWIIDHGKWDNLNAESMIVFDPMFAGLPRDVRKNRVWRYATYILV